MVTRRSAIVGLALGALIGLTGCVPADDRSAPDPARPSAGLTASPAAQQSDVRAELVAAAARLAHNTARVRVSVAGQMSMTGVIDPRSQDASMDMDMGMVDDGTKAEIRKVGPDMWVRFHGSLGTLLGAGDQWLHLSAADIPAESSFNVITGDDPAGVAAMVNAATEVERTGKDGFAGVLDLTRTPKYSARTLTALGAKASAVPFTAKTDAQGRLIMLTTDLSAIVSGAGTATTRFSDFGVAVDVEQPPAGETTELPAQLKSVIDA
jgi:hypothetical protein